MKLRKRKEVEDEQSDSVGESSSLPLSRKDRRSRKKRKKWLKRLVYLLVFLLLLSGGLVGATYFYASYRFSEVTKVHLKSLTSTTQGSQGLQGPFNILLIGSDSRAFETNPQQAKAFGSPNQYGGQRADVIIVARVDPASHQISMLSIPRDTLVAIAGTKGNDKINAAFNNGPDQLIESIQQDFGIPINHYVQVNFEGLSNMVDALGGINLNFPNEVKDNYSGLNITTTGCQTLNGGQALSLVRSRHLYYKTQYGWNYDGMSDWSRIRRQQAFFRAVITKAESSITNPLKLNSFIGAAVSNLTIDSTWGESELISLANEFHSFPYNDLQTNVLPTTSYGATSSYLYPAQPFASQVIANFMSLGSTNSTTTSSTSLPTSTTQLNPSSINVQVLDGSGHPGIAVTTASSLKGLGVNVVSTGNNSNFNVQTTQIEYPAGQQLAAEYLASKVGGSVGIVPLQNSSNKNIVLIIGKSFTSIISGVSSTTTSTTVPVSTTLPISTGKTAPNSQIVFDTPNSLAEPWNPVPC